MVSSKVSRHPFIIKTKTSCKKQNNKTKIERKKENKKVILSDHIQVLTKPLEYMIKEALSILNQNFVAYNNLISQCFLIG